MLAAARAARGQRAQGSVKRCDRLAAQAPARVVVVVAAAAARGRDVQPDPATPPPAPPVLPRRNALLASLAAALTVAAAGAPATAAAATAAATTSDAAASAAAASAAAAALTTAGTTPASTVPANLSASAYLQLIADARRASWPLIARCIGSSDWTGLARLLVQPPFDDVRAAAFFLPWSLMQVDDYAAAVEVRKGYTDFVEHVHDLAAVALSAADGEAGGAGAAGVGAPSAAAAAAAAAPKEAAGRAVQQAFLLLSASLDRLLSAVPIKYTAAAGEAMALARQQQQQRGGGVVATTADAAASSSSAAL